jgi:hypothetical protein
MWFARAGFPPGARAKKNALLAPNHAQRLGAFIFGDCDPSQTQSD